MQRTLLFKKFLMPCGLCAAVPAIKPANPPEEQTKPCCNETKSEKLIKPSKLPIYAIEDVYSEQVPCPEYSRSIVEENIRKVRIQIQELSHVYDDVSKNVSATVDNFKFIINYLQDEVNLMPRLGAVGIGGLSGFILGLRGGFFKRLGYTTVGTGIAAAVCFPKETKEAFNTVEHYGHITYNFIYGVKPGDNKEETSFRELPLVKNVLESEYFQLLTRPFEQKVSNTATEKKEENPPSKSEVKKE
ncbi:MICOS complex subunit 26/27 [Nomia melanderi]|uniref:MICOS complex subunit 26/27 n=1 Tax=Nomia melanderi TaxID=2448451 RepID=UPI0013042FBC|nr:MICOS complex subunit MIC27 [Nomia melanderi]